jgi:hypothetical protein
MGELREHLGESLSGVLAGSDRRELYKRMGEEQTNQLLAGVAGSTYDCHGFLVHEIAAFFRTKLSGRILKVWELRSRTQ